MYQFQTRVRYSEVDENSMMTLSSLIDCFQDCSVFQSESLDLGVSYLKEHQLAWVLSSWQICCKQLPKLGESIYVQTWPYEMKAFYGYRNFALENDAGNRLAYANSIWVLVDTQTQRPVKVPQEMITRYGLEQAIEMTHCPRKLFVPKDTQEGTPVQVQSYFIDTNKHMNNGKYVMLAQEYLPKDFKIGEIRVEYKKAARLHDILYPRYSLKENEVNVVLNDEGGKPYAIVVFCAEMEQ